MPSGIGNDMVSWDKVIWKRKLLTNFKWAKVTTSLKNALLGGDTLKIKEVVVLIDRTCTSKPDTTSTGSVKHILMMREEDLKQQQKMKAPSQLFFISALFFWCALKSIHVSETAYRYLFLFRIELGIDWDSTSLFLGISLGFGYRAGRRDVYDLFCLYGNN